MLVTDSCEYQNILILLDVNNFYGCLRSSKRFQQKRGGQGTMVQFEMINCLICY